MLCWVGLTDSIYSYMQDLRSHVNGSMLILWLIILKLLPLLLGLVLLKKGHLKTELKSKVVAKNLVV